MIEAPLTASLLALASENALPAGGAPLDQLAALALVNLGGTAALLWLVRAHRAGRVRVLTRAASLAGWVFRLPGWAALPVLVAVVSMLTVMFGGFWDIGYHIDVGRDEGPLGNAGHWPQMLGFFGILVAGVLTAALADERHASPAWVRIAPGWRVPVGGVLLVGSALFTMLALPLDDVWHRVYGQDVTLWSPTHFMLLGGSTFAVIALVVLVTEGSRARRAEAPEAQSQVASRSGPNHLSPPAAEAGNGHRPWARIELLRGQSLLARAGRVWWWVQRVGLIGGMLVGLEAFLAEYDWGVPLYRQVWQPLLLAAFAGFVFVAARGVAGRGGALGAWGIYLVTRSAASLMPVLADRSEAMLPLFLVEALCVEAAALRLDPRRRPLAFGATAGLLCGTIGFAGEYAWSQFAMPLPWTPALLAEGLPSAALAGVAGGLLGVLLASGLRGELPSPRIARTAWIGAFAVLAALAVNAGIREVPDAQVQAELTEVRSEPRREALGTFRLEPPSAADDVNWLYVLAWQGGDDRVVDRLRRVGEGVYRSTEPIPLHGTWKSGLRLHRGRERGAVPIRLPSDEGLAASAGASASEERVPASYTRVEEVGEAIRAGAELPAPASFTRPFTDDGLIVVREQKDDVPAWVWTAGISLIFMIYAVFIAGLTLGVARMARRGAAPEPSPAAPGTRPAIPPAVVSSRAPR